MSNRLQENAINHALNLKCWTAPEKARLLGGGITNLNVYLEDQEKAYVVRLGNDIPVHGILRFNELAISKAANLAGIAPKVYYHEQGALVLEFINAAPLSEADVANQKNLPAIINLIKDCHTKIMPHLRGAIVSFWVFHIVRDYAQSLESFNSDHVSKLPDLLNAANILEKAVGPVDIVLGHNDLLAANILKSDERLWLIDWEYGGFNSPLFDLGGLATNNGLSEAQEVQMLKQYFGEAPSQELLKSYNAMKCASLLRETLWSMVSETTSEIEFDYKTYSKENLANFESTFSKFKSDWNIK